MKQYGLFLAFAAMFLLFACDNNLKSKNDGTPQNDEAVTDADTAQNDGTVTDDILPDGALPDGAQPDDMGSDGTLPDGAQPDGTQPDDAQPDDAQPDNTPSDDTVAEGTLPDDTIPDEAQPDDTTVDEALPDEDIAYPTISSITYEYTLDPWTTGSDVLDGNAVIVTMVGQPPDLFAAPAAFVSSKSFIDVSIYKEANSPEYVRVRLSRVQVGTSFPVTVTLQPPLVAKSLKTISQAEWFNGELVNGFLTGDLTITAFNEGTEEPGSITTLFFSGNDLTFTPTN